MWIKNTPPALPAGRGFGKGAVCWAGLVPADGPLDTAVVWRLTTDAPFAVGFTGLTWQVDQVDVDQQGCFLDLHDRSHRPFHSGSFRVHVSSVEKGNEMKQKLTPFLSLADSLFPRKCVL